MAGFPEQQHPRGSWGTWGYLGVPGHGLGVSSEAGSPPELPAGFAAREAWGCAACSGPDLFLLLAPLRAASRSCDACVKGTGSRAEASLAVVQRLNCPHAL